MALLALPNARFLKTYLSDVTRCRSTSELMATMKRHGVATTKDPADLDALNSALKAKNNSVRVLSEFWTAILPDVATRAGQLHTLFPEGGVPVVDGVETREFACSRRQCAALICGMFLGVFSAGRSTGGKGSRSPPNSFIRMLTGRPDRCRARIQMILAYFAALSDGSEQTARLMQGAIYIRRESVDARKTLQMLAACTEPVQPIAILPRESISTVMGCLQADFANKNIGGGSLGGGCVQEEILFAEAPEHILAMLICPQMQPNEAIAITGAGDWSRSSGYSSSLKFRGENTDSQGATLGELGFGDDVNPATIARATVAIDAIHYNTSLPHSDLIATQLERGMLERELVKAYAGFSMEGPELDFCRDSGR